MRIIITHIQQQVGVPVKTVTSQAGLAGIDGHTFVRSAPHDCARGGAPRGGRGEMPKIAEGGERHGLHLRAPKGSEALLPEDVYPRLVGGLGPSSFHTQSLAAWGSPDCEGSQLEYRQDPALSVPTLARIGRGSRWTLASLGKAEIPVRCISAVLPRILG
jgi:hypothetical protein